MCIIGLITDKSSLTTQIGRLCTVNACQRTDSWTVEKTLRFRY